MGSRAFNFFTRFRRPLPADAILGNHSLDEVSLSSISVISMLCLGEMDLAGGSLALAFANTTGYSVLKGLAMGMEGTHLLPSLWGPRNRPFSSRPTKGLSSVSSSFAFPISLLWLNMEPPFPRLGQGGGFFEVARACMVCFVPELFAQAHLQPLRTFLRTQGLTTPVSMQLPQKQPQSYHLRNGDHDPNSRLTPHAPFCSKLEPLHLRWPRAQSVGVNRAEPVFYPLWVSPTASIVLGFLTFIFMITMRSAFGRMYTSELEILNLVSASLPILGLCELAIAPQTAVYGVPRWSAYKAIFVLLHWNADLLFYRPSSGSSVSGGYGLGC